MSSSVNSRKPVDQISGLFVRDKTTSVACHVELVGPSQYFVTVNGKKLINPTSQPKSEDRLLFAGITLIKFKEKGQFLKITSCNSDTKTRHYIDTTKTADGVAFDTFTYLPKERVSLEAAVEKMQNLPAFPDFTPLRAFYNRHGVVVFGRGPKGYEIFWGKPDEKEVKRIPCSMCKGYPHPMANARDATLSFGAPYMVAFINGDMDVNEIPEDRFPKRASEVPVPVPPSGAPTSTLPSGLAVYDKTTSMTCTVTYLPDESTRKGRTCYNLTVNGKKLIRQTGFSELVFTRSRSMKFEQVGVEGKILQITEKDETNTLVLYVDTSKLVDGVAYYALTYLPQELSLGQAVQRIQNLTLFPDFKPEAAVYCNRGVVVFGKNSQGYAIFWAKPQQEEVVSIRSADQDLNFVYDTGSRCFYMNGEACKTIPADRYPQTQPSSTAFYLASQPDDNGARFILTYEPKSVSLEQAQAKLTNLESEFPGFTIQYAVYNSQGVAVYGVNNKGCATLLWASPDEPTVKMRDSQFFCVRDGTVYAKSKDAHVNFGFVALERFFYLNGEKATPYGNTSVSFSAR